MFKISAVKDMGPAERDCSTGKRQKSFNAARQRAARRLQGREREGPFDLLPSRVARPTISSTLYRVVLVQRARPKVIRIPSHGSPRIVPLEPSSAQLEGSCTWFRRGRSRHQRPLGPADRTRASGDSKQSATTPCIRATINSVELISVTDCESDT
jgi:hypothetical protein